MGPAQIERADRWFQRYGEPIVLFGRLIPLLRAFVSLPAGIARMPVLRFTRADADRLAPVGARRWRSPVMRVGGDWTSVRKGFEYVDYVVLALIVIGVAYLVVRRRGRGTPVEPAEPVEPVDARDGVRVFNDAG